MRRDVSVSVATVILVLGTASVLPAQVVSQPSQGRIISSLSAPPKPRVQPPAPQRLGVICHVSRSALVAPRGVLLAPVYASFVPYQPFVSGYAPTYNNYNYSPGYSSYASPGESSADSARIDVRRERPIAPLRLREAAVKAEQLIARGDESFAKGAYTRAIARYREAGQIASDAFDARLRHALALVAARKYPAAVRVFFDATNLRPDWADAKVDLARLYGPDELDRVTAEITQSADRDATNGELALSAGLQLFFSGKREAAARYFRRATQLGADKYGRLADVLSADEAQARK